MTRRWLKERKREHYYRLAKKKELRSRAAFKLFQINEKYHVIKRGDVVVDLGCAPGGWLQVAVELTGTGGFVAGVDLDDIKSLDGVSFIKGDMTEEGTREELKALLSDNDEAADVVLSDMSPDISGNYSVDHANSVFLCETALEFAGEILRPGGAMVLKVFEGDMYGEFLKKLKQEFRVVKAHSPKASRASSSEIYLICKGFKK